MKITKNKGLSNQIKAKNCGIKGGWFGLWLFLAGIGQGLLRNGFNFQ